MSHDEKALFPEDLARQFVERADAANAAAAAGIAALYEEHAVMAFPPGGTTSGREAIRELWVTVLAAVPHFESQAPLATLTSGDIALTCTVAKDGTGARVPVARRQSDGSWLRLLDQPEVMTPTRVASPS